MFENLKHTELESDLFQGYTVFIEHSHGDADALEYSTWKTPTLDGLKTYILEFEKVSERIDYARSTGGNYRNIQSDLIQVYEDFIFEGSGVPAAMRIEKIEYVSGEKKYMVTGWE